MKHIIKPAFSLFLIAAITTALLGVVYRITLDPIEIQHRRTQERLMKEILPQVSEFRELEINAGGNINRVFEGLSGGETTAYILELAPNGYSGTITMLVGIRNTENDIAGIRVLSHSETPGLGALAVRENFYRSFDSLPLVPLRVVKSSPEAGEIETITSATITTRAISDAVNEAIEWYNKGNFK